MGKNRLCVAFKTQTQAVLPLTLRSRVAGRIGALWRVLCVALYRRVVVWGGGVLRVVWACCGVRSWRVVVWWRVV